MEEEDDDPRAPLVAEDGRVSRRRWYVLRMFGMINVIENAVYNTWGPLAQSAEAVFGWTDSQIGQFANMANIAYLITVFPVCYLMEKIVLRWSIVGCTLLIFIGSGLRCITYEQEAATWLSYACAVFTGIGAAVPFAGPSLVANTWFPLKERATATAVTSVFMSLGMGTSFVIGSELVASPKYKNSTGASNISEVYHNIRTNGLRSMELSHGISSWSVESKSSKQTSTVDVTNFDTMQSDIMILLYSECGLAGVIFLMCLVYLPSKPPTPPSTSASIQRTNYKEALGSVAKNHALILLCLASAIPIGVFGSWQAVLDVLLDPIGLNQEEAGWLGFYITIAGGVSGLLLGRFSDIFLKNTKFFIILLYGGSSLCYVWFSLLSAGIISPSKVQIYLSTIIGGMLINGSLPLVFEMGSELAFPVSEAIVGAFLTCLINLSGILILLVLLIPNIGTSWMSWSLVGSLVLGFVFLFLFPARYSRTDIDIRKNIHKDSGSAKNKHTKASTERTAICNN